MPPRAASSSNIEPQRYRVFIPPSSRSRHTRTTWLRRDEEWTRSEESAESPRWQQSATSSDHAASVSHTRFIPLPTARNSLLSAQAIAGLPSRVLTKAQVSPPQTTPGQGRGQSVHKTSPQERQEGEDMTSWTETFVRGLVQQEADATREAAGAVREAGGEADMTNRPFSIGTVAVGDALRAVNAEDEGVAAVQILADAYRSGTQADEAIGDALRATTPEEELRIDEDDEREDSGNGQHQQHTREEDDSVTTSRVRFVTAKAMMASTQLAAAQAKTTRVRPPLVVIGSQDSARGDLQDDEARQTEHAELPKGSPAKRAGGRVVMIPPPPAPSTGDPSLHSNAAQEHSMESYESRSYASASCPSNVGSQSMDLNGTAQQALQRLSQDSQSNSLDAALRVAAETTKGGTSAVQGRQTCIQRSTQQPMCHDGSHTTLAASAARHAELPHRSERSHSDGDAGRKRTRPMLNDDPSDCHSVMRLVKAPRVETSPPRVPSRRSGLVFVEPRTAAPSKTPQTQRRDGEPSRFVAHSTIASNNRLVFVQPASTPGKGQCRSLSTSDLAPRTGCMTVDESSRAGLNSESSRPPLSRLRSSRLSVAHCPESMMSASTDASMTSSSNGVDSIPPPPTLRFDPSSVTSLSTVARQPQLFLPDHLGGPRGQTSAVRFNVLALVREIGSLDEVNAKVYQGGKLIEGRLERTFRSHLILQDGRDAALLKVTLWGECARVWASLEGDDSGADESSLAAGTTAAGMSTLLRDGPRVGGATQAALRTGDVVFLESIVLTKSDKGYEGSASPRTASSLELCWRWDARSDRDRRRYAFDPELAVLDRRCRDVWRCAQLWS